jgi:hypothetical protein
MANGRRNEGKGRKIKSPSFGFLGWQADVQKLETL